MIEFLNNFALAQLLICSFLLLPYWRKGTSIVLFVLLMLSSSAYLLTNLYETPDSSFLLKAIGFVGGNALPGVFWLVSLRIFGDHHELSSKLYAIASTTLLLPLSVKVILFLATFSVDQQLLILKISRSIGVVLELGLISHALYISASNWRNDLVLERRFIRGGVISLSAIYIMLIILFEQVFPLNSELVELTKAIAVATLTTAINLILFKPKSSTLFEPKMTALAVEEPKQENKLLADLLHSMNIDKLYREDGITISSLASQLSSQEYVLRSLINKELGYRNFNDFLNHYRIEEITAKIKSDPESNTPILTLALESGFRSLSSFNKVFKQTHQLTPTEFKKKCLTDY